MAAAAVATIADPAIREWQLAELVLSSAAGGDPAASDAELQAALETFRRQEQPFRVVAVALALAEKAKKRGAALESDRWLAEAQRVVETLAAGLEPVQDRHGYLAAAGRALRARIQAAVEAGRARKALELYLREQQLRRRATLVGAWEAPAELDRDPSLPVLPPGTGFAAYLELPEGPAGGARFDRQRGRPAPAPGRRRRAGRGGGGAASAHRRAAPLARSGAAAAVKTPSASSAGSWSRRSKLGCPAPGGWAWRSTMSSRAFPSKRLRVFRQAAGGAFRNDPAGRPEALLHDPHPLAPAGPDGLVLGADQPARYWKLGALRGVAAEIATIAGALGVPRHRLLAGAECTRRQVLRELPAARWLHFAGHALEDPADPSSSLLVLAEDGAEPAALTIEDLAKASRGQLEMVVLSGCETARAGTGGIVQALERSGVPITIGSLWVVNDQATAKFFAELYQLLAAGVPPIQALHRTRLAALRSKDPSSPRSRPGPLSPAGDGER